MAITPGPIPSGAGRMSPEEMKSDLQQDFQGLNSLKGELAAGREKTTEAGLSQKESIIKEVFDMMLESGVDPSSPEQVSAFLEKLQTDNPDLLELFMKAFSALTGQALPGVAGAAAPNPKVGMPPNPLGGGMVKPGGMGQAMPPKPAMGMGAAMPPRPAAPAENPMKKFSNLGKPPMAPPQV